MLVFALRHADRTPDPAADLTPAGLARAKLLARMLAESGVRKAFCSSARRAQRTIAPLKEMLGEELTVTTIDINSADHELQNVIGVKALPQDAVAVIVGHSDTVVEIIKRLTGRTVDEIEAHQFDKLFVLSLAAGASTVAQLRYGEPT